MEIDDINSYLVGPAEGKNFCFVRIETASGGHGWGECSTQFDRDVQIKTHVEQIARYLIGRDPAHIKHFLQWVFEDFASRRGSADFYSAVSGIEQALWDIQGKELGVPVHRLLGGACRGRIKVYANGWAMHTNGLEELADAADAVVAQGFDAIKFDPVSGPWRTHVDSGVVDDAVKRVRVVREAVGPDVDILIDMHRRLAPAQTEVIARRIRDFDPFWYEEPVLDTNLEVLASVKQNIDIPVVTGERRYTKHDFFDVFDNHSADIINPDVCHAGGILELKEIAAMAEPYFVAVSPHNFNSTSVGLASTLHVSAAIPNFLIAEYMVNFEQFSETIACNSFEINDGFIRLPDAPGLGIDLDEERLSQLEYQKMPRRNIRQYYEET